MNCSINYIFISLHSFISLINSGVSSVVIFTTSANAKYIRMAVQTSNEFANNIVVYKTSIEPLC